MAKREAYARGAAEVAGVECTPGLELREGDDAEELCQEVQRVAKTALEMWGGHHINVCSFVERYFTAYYPDRAYFVETEEEGRGVQVFQPYGLPREE